MPVIWALFWWVLKGPFGPWLASNSVPHQKPILELPSLIISKSTGLSDDFLNLYTLLPCFFIIVSFPFRLSKHLFVTVLIHLAIWFHITTVSPSKFHSPLSITLSLNNVILSPFRPLHLVLGYVLFRTPFLSTSNALS